MVKIFSVVLIAIFATSQAVRHSVTNRAKEGIFISPEMYSMCLYRLLKFVYVTEKERAK